MEDLFKWGGASAGWATIYGPDKKENIIISNMLLEKYQIGTKKSELQMRVAEEF